MYSSPSRGFLAQLAPYANYLLQREEAPEDPELKTNTAIYSRRFVLALLEGFDFSSCPEWSSCQNHPVYSLWRQASQTFAELACGNITVLLNGSIANAFDKKSMFGSVELDSLNPQSVDYVNIKVVANLEGPYIESCSQGSVLDLIQILRSRGFSWTCTDNDHKGYKKTPTSVGISKKCGYSCKISSIVGECLDIHDLRQPSLKLHQSDRHTPPTASPGGKDSWNGANLATSPRTGAHGVAPQIGVRSRAQFTVNKSPERLPDAQGSSLRRENFEMEHGDVRPPRRRRRSCVIMSIATVLLLIVVVVVLALTLSQKADNLKRTFIARCEKFQGTNCTNASLRNLQEELDDGIKYNCTEVAESQVLDCSSDPEKPCGACW
ncbi:hypothetical protein F2P81_021758 [Scophthalmus maximus]|uniref:ADP-ribosyl cyclase/cyclic ADP-ribose hydrolase n=1 Tax=Scophthalmus maximus TaxID=52904 RepID=A0A6A4RWQ9_SCOMX|nr:hypothetical protein F2P81_021758 [Scophthalmus maximus]